MSSIPSDYLYFPAPLLRDFTAHIMVTGGFTAAEAAITADSLILSNLYGHDSHGIMRVSEYMSFLRSGEIISGAPLDIIQESSSHLQANGNFGLGQVQMSRFLDKLADKAGHQAVTCGAMYNCAHIGRLGEWSERLAARGLAAMVCANDNGTLQFVAPPGGIDGRTSTNPLALGIPLPHDDVFSLDISTSAVAIGKIKLAYQAGERVPVGLLQDHKGNPTTDPSIIFITPKGTLRPMGGDQSYKGFGLSVFIDLLVAGLSSGFAPPAPPLTKSSNNVVITIWNPDFFSGLSHMQQEAEKYLAFIRQSRPTPDMPSIRLPGDRAKTEHLSRQKTGIPVSRGTLEKITRLAGHCGATIPTTISDALS